MSRTSLPLRNKQSYRIQRLTSYKGIEPSIIGLTVTQNQDCKSVVSVP